MTITGSGFTTTQAVRFGVSDGSPQGTFTIVSDAQLSVIAPAGSGLVDIIVMSSYGESAATIAAHFTYPALAPPVVSSIIPGGGYVNDQVTITGSGFAEGCAVHFGTESAAFSVQSDTIMTALAPDLSGVVHVTVSNAGGTSAETSADLFTYGGDNLPHTSATNVQKSGYDGWAQGSVTVTLTASVNNGYGIAKTLYQIDNAGIVEYAGPFVISGVGCHQIQYWSVDLRGNVEPVNIGWVNILSASVVPAGLTVTPLFDMVLAEWDLLVAPTTISFRLYAGESAESVTTLVASTSANVASVKQLATAGPRWYAVSSVDVEGNESARSAVAGPVTAQAVVIPDGSLDVTKFASGIVPPRVVSALPVLPERRLSGGVAGVPHDGRQALQHPDRCGRFVGQRRQRRRPHGHHRRGSDRSRRGRSRCPGERRHHGLQVRPDHQDPPDPFRAACAARPRVSAGHRHLHPQRGPALQGRGGRRPYPDHDRERSPQRARRRQQRAGRRPRRMEGHERRSRRLGVVGR